MTLTMGSLFDGIGGFPLAFDRHGFDCRWSVEIDKDCAKVLNRHWPDVPKHLDVRDVGGHNLDHVNVITFGSPCQDLSVAGNRAGMGHETRSGLFYEAIRICDELRPDFALWENVPGAFSSNAGRDFAAVLNAFQELGARDICWRTLDAQYFGVPQRRRRIFLIADFTGERAGEILFESEDGSGDSAESREARAELATDVAASLKHGGGNGRGYNLDAESGLAVVNSVSTEQDQSAEEASVESGDDPRVVVDGFHTTGAGYWQDRAGCLSASDDNGSNRVVVGFSSKDHGGDAQEELAPTMRSMNYDQSHLNGGGQLAVAFAENQRGEVRTSDVHPQLTTGGGKPGQGYPAVMVEDEPQDVAIFKKRGGFGISEGKNVSPTLESEGGTHQGGPERVPMVFESRVARNGRGDPSSIVPPLKAQSGQTGKGGAASLVLSVTERTRNGERQVETQENLSYSLNNPGAGGRSQERQIAGSFGVRRLTPVECERLMGFPDLWTAEDADGKPIADSARYRMLGNSIAVPVVEWIARRMRVVLHDRLTH